VIVQDEASSAVWGMPGAVAREGLAAAIAPVAQLADTIAFRLGGSQKSEAP
ncbi:MAG: chemotaxis response regulator protein-glutamate methylesterase, partial [Hyphomicrobiales bacterium]|nr:chemotaxis response regulator protein-glutamate methylesterase [Hyphomicrobiales bacterium]MCC2106639.1 chemotaxis response regulator protein-glutamate methylesterase [Hyphomicrobiales bacterium]